MDQPSAVNWAEGDPQLLAEQFLSITGGCIRRDNKIFFALVAAIAAASIHNLRVPAQDSQQHVQNIMSTAAAIAAARQSKSTSKQASSSDTEATPAGQKSAAAAAPLPAALQQLESVVSQLLLQQQMQLLLQQQQQQQQDAEQVLTKAFEVGHPLLVTHRPFLLQHPPACNIVRFYPSLL